MDFAVPQKRKTNSQVERGNLRKEIQEVLNKLWKETTGSNKIPYTRWKENNGGFDIVGLPEGLEFKPVNEINMEMLRKLKEAISKGEVKFVRKDSTN